MSIVLSSRGDFFLSIYQNHLIKWDPAKQKGEEILSFPDMLPFSFVLSSDNRLLAVGYKSGFLKITDRT